VEFLYVDILFMSVHCWSILESKDRLENEHLGNMDQYRVSREVPLPYSQDELVRESDKEEQSDEDRRSGFAWFKRPRTASPLRNQTDTNEIRLN
jgi:hypothetical protein